MVKEGALGPRPVYERRDVSCGDIVVVAECRARKRKKCEPRKVINTSRERYSHRFGVLPLPS